MCFEWARYQLSSGTPAPCELPETLEVHPDQETPSVHDLSTMLDSAGSDKGTRNGYADLYQQWSVGKRTQVSVVVEVGLGSPSGLTPSNMGPEARPGASLLAFAEFFPSAKLIGADVDPRSFPSHRRISCFQVDQLRAPTFSPVVQKLTTFKGFDLAVVDGLHVPEADINSLLILLPWLRRGGLLSIEDIGHDPKILVEWDALLNNLPPPWEGKLVRFPRSHIAAITRI